MDTMAVHKWLVVQALDEAGLAAAGAARLDLDQEKAKVAERQAAKLDLELARMRGELVSASEICLALAAQDTVVKDRLLSVPMAAADRAAEAAAKDGPQGVARVYTAAIRAALEALASMEVVPVAQQ